MRIAVIGCGRIGLVTGGCLAAVGHEVKCADRNQDLLQSLQHGHLPFFESYLDQVIRQGLASRKLAFSSDTSETSRASDVIFLCVGVPHLENGDPDFSALDAAARQIGEFAESPKLVVERSTVPLQTGEQLKQLLAVYNRGRAARFCVAANPQFLREGTAVNDFLHPDRILVGVDDTDSEELLRQIYGPILRQEFSCPIHPDGCPPRESPEFFVTGVRSAELIKHAANAFLAVKISYANVLADLCERLEGNVQEVTQAIGLDPRIRPHLLRAGLGFGGSRLPRDLRTFRRLAERAGVDAGILQAAEEINRSRVESFLKKVGKALWVLKDKQIALLGLAYKPGTDDIRDSPAIQLLQRLLAAGARVRAYDPQAMPTVHAALPEIVCAASAYEAAESADALLVATEWEEFRDLDWPRIRDLMARPLILDARNLLSPGLMKSLGFEYESVGRPDS